MSKPKFKIGQQVWYFDEGQGCPKPDTIETYEEDLDMYFLKDNGNIFDPSDLFSTKRKCREAHL